MSSKTTEKQKQRHYAVAAITAANIFNALWLLGPVLNPSIDWVRQFASFYASSCEPHYAFFRIIDIGFFASIIIWILAAKRAYKPAFLIVMGLVGLATFSDALFPTGCLRPEAPHLGFLQEIRHIHSLTSGVGFIASCAAITYIAYKLYKTMPWKHLTVAAYIVTTLCFLEYNYAVFLPNNAFVGVLQRINILLFSLWLLAVPFISERSSRLTKTTKELQPASSKRR